MRGSHRGPSGHSRRRVILILLIVLLGLGVFRYTRPLPALYPISNLPVVPSVSPVLTWPASGQAAIGAAGYSVLASSPTQTMLPTASTAKLITALTVLKKYPLALGQSGPTITLSSNDVTIYNNYVAEQGSVATVTAGEQISEYQMLQGMLLPSANNLADSLAIWAYGSLPAYRVAAVVEVHSLGLSQTQVGTDASGFLPSTKSTTHDLVLLGEAALQNPVLAQIVNQTHATLPVAGTVPNVNWLLGEDGIIGIKTGNNNQSGGVYIFAAKYAITPTHSVTIIGALQNTPTLQNALDAGIVLLNSAKRNFSLMNSVVAGQTVGHYSVPWGSSVAAVATRAVPVVAWAQKPPQPVVSLHTIQAPQTTGTTVGTLSSGGSDPGTTTLVLQQKITSPSWWWRLIRHTT